MYLPTNWDNVKQFLSAETLNSLASWIEILPEDEKSIQQEELNVIRAKAQELESLLGSSTLGEKLKLLVSRQVQSLEKAVAGYSIIGARALTAAAFSALGELIHMERTIQDNCDKPEVRKLIDMWEKLSKLADQALPIEGDMAGEEGGGIRKNPWTTLCPSSP